MLNDESTLPLKASGPRGYPLIGVIPHLRKDPLNFFLSTAIEYGDVAKLDLGPREFYLVTQPESIKYILQDNNRNYRKGYDQAKPLLGEGLVTSEGNFWLQQRRLIQPLFLQSQIGRYIPFITAATDEMLAEWEIHALNNKPVDVAHEMMRLTQKIILRTMFSTDTGAETEQIAHAFDMSLEHLNQILFSPSRILDRLPTPANIRHRHALEYLNKFVFDLISQRRLSKKESNDLLSRLIQARDSETGLGMSDQQVRDEVMTIFLAGHETTANALAWTWYLLANSPGQYDSLVSEIDQVLAGRTPTENDLAALIFSRMVFDETLRLYPPAWMFARHAIEDDEVGGYFIPANSMLMISPYVTHRLPDIWHDPEYFYPQRFNSENIGQRHKFAYFPFGGGPRVCIGNMFAITEGLIILSMVTQYFRLSLVPQQNIKPTPIATLQPKPGVFMNLIGRN